MILEKFVNLPDPLLDIQKAILTRLLPQTKTHLDPHTGVRNYLSWWPALFYGLDFLSQFGRAATRAREDWRYSIPEPVARESIPGVLGDLFSARHSFGWKGHWTALGIVFSDWRAVS